MIVVMRCQVKGCDAEVDAPSRDEAVCLACERRAIQAAHQALDRLASMGRELTENAATLNKVLPSQAINDNSKPW